MMQYLVNRGKEPSTWAALGALAVALGQLFPEAAGAANTAAMILGGVGAVLGDKKGTAK